jgi:hypothetical protein
VDLMFRGLFGKAGGAAPAPTPVLSEPIRLSDGRLTFEVGTTTRRDLERRMRPPISYPVPGWQTWTVAGPKDETWILSAFYRDGILVAVEHYVAKTNRLPSYAPKITGGFRFVPDEISLGGKITGLPAHFVAGASGGGTVTSVVFQQLFAARWSTGIALVSGNDARIERLALYANLK